jgi:oligoribonuclease NrnB/cAMP/cGMP phosphodiesterase (DHH superfamily)
MKYNYIIFHKNCVDGFTGFYLFTKTKKFESKPIVYPDHPSATEIPPDIDGKKIIIIDVAYKPSILKQIGDRAEKVLFLDHHKSHEKEILELNCPKIEMVFKNDRCGASLVWDYFFPKKKRPEFLNYVEDNDLGLWKLSNTHDFITGLEVKHTMMPTFPNLKKWDKLLVNSYLNELITSGKTYNEYKQFLTGQNGKKYDLMLFPSDYMIKKLSLDETKHRVAVVNGGSPSVSLLGKYIVETANCDYCIIWRYDPKNLNYILSFRSNKVDVGEIAKSIGGGGHKFASASTVSAINIPITSLFDPIK